MRKGKPTEGNRTRERLRWWYGLIVAMLILGAIYVGAYFYVRSQHHLVHYSGYAHGNTDNHRIDVGTHYRDRFYTGVVDIEVVGYWVFTPLRWAEAGYWYVRHPKGKPWPYD